MAEREHGTAQKAADERDEVVAHPAGFEGETGHAGSEPSTADPREEERHRRVMASAERVMRKHRNVFAALAK